MIIDIHSEINSGIDLEYIPFQELFNQVVFATKIELSSFKSSLSLVFVDDKKIRQLNAEYRQKETATDVLSFSFLDDNSPELGEIIISLDTAMVQANEHNHDILTEIQVLFVHGLLHILGFDHLQDNQAKEMLKYEQIVLGDKAGLIFRAGL